MLALELDGLAPLRSPVMLIALGGLFDIAEVATTALDTFAPADAAITFGEIDPDPFYDFTQERPTVEIDEGDLRVIRWPENRFDVVRAPAGGNGRDLVVLLGTEPHLGWPTYSKCVIEVARRLGCEAVVTLGAAAEAMPHTRPPVVNASTTDPELASRLGIGLPTYQGVTGVIGVIQADLAAAGIPSVSLRVGIPHYLMNAEHPRALAALKTHLAHVLGMPVPPEDPELAGEIARWSALHDEVVDGDVQLQFYLRLLEQDYDRRAEEAIPSADDLGAQFEQFLREQRGDGTSDV